MRFISIATTLFLAATALAAGAQQGKGCERECYLSHTEAEAACKRNAPAVFRESNACFKCCQAIV